MLIFCRQFAIFAIEANVTSSSNPQFYTLQTNGWKSVCVLTSLPPTHLLALLLAENFVKEKRRGKGINQNVSILPNELDDMGREATELASLIPGTMKINLCCEPPGVNLKMHQKHNLTDALEDLPNTYTLDHEEEVKTVCG